MPGYNVRPLEICAAVGLVQLGKLERMIAIRRANAACFIERFGGDERFILQREHGVSSWFSFTIILNPGLGIDRARVMDAMRQADIGFRMITGGCFLRHEAAKFFDYDTAGEIVNANIACNSSCIARMTSEWYRATKSSWVTKLTKTKW